MPPGLRVVVVVYPGSSSGGFSGGGGCSLFCPVPGLGGPQTDGGRVAV